MKRILPLLLISMLCGGCVPDPLPLEIEQIEPSPVIWSQAIPDQSVIVYMARTFGALEYSENNNADTSGQALLSQVLTSNALLTLSGGGQTDTLGEISNGLYATLNANLIPGEEYTLKALDPLLNKRVEATTRMMPTVSLNNLSYTIINDTTLDVHYQFADPPGANYYAIHFYSRFNDPLEIPDPLEAGGIVKTELISDLEVGTGLINRTYRLDFLESDTLYVSLNNISETYFDYLQQRERSGNLFTQAVAEPITFLSNVTGGYGIFTLHFPDIQMLVVE